MLRPLPNLTMNRVSAGYDGSQDHKAPEKEPFMGICTHDDFSTKVASAPAKGAVFPDGPLTGHEALCSGNADENPV